MEGRLVKPALVLAQVQLATREQALGRHPTRNGRVAREQGTARRIA